jgi:hypothetical protein
MQDFKQHRIDARYTSGTFATSEAAVITVAALLPPGVRAAHRSPGHWQVELTWRYHDGEVRAEPTEMRIRFGPGREHDSTVTASLVRNLPLGNMIEESRRALIAKAARQVDEPSAVPNEMWAKFAGVGPRRGTEITPEQDQAAAAVYRQAWKDAKPVTAAVAEHFDISKSAASKRIGKARAAGLLKGMGPKQ